MAQESKYGRWQSAIARRVYQLELEPCEMEILKRDRFFSRRECALLIASNTDINWIGVDGCVIDRRQI